MSDTKHTPEPWRVRLTNNAVYYIFRYTGNGDEEEVIEYFTHDNPGQDSSRIVACVNACAGMADPEKGIAALRAAAEKAREALKVSWTVLRDLRDDWRCVAGAESIQYIRADNAHKNSLAALAALEEVIR